MSDSAPDVPMTPEEQAQLHQIVDDLQEALDLRIAADQTQEERVRQIVRELIPEIVQAAVEAVSERRRANAMAIRRSLDELTARETATVASQASAPDRTGAPPRTPDTAAGEP